MEFGNQNIIPVPPHTLMLFYISHYVLLIWIVPVPVLSQLPDINLTQSKNESQGQKPPSCLASRVQCPSGYGCEIGAGSDPSGSICVPCEESPYAPGCTNITTTILVVLVVVLIVGLVVAAFVCFFLPSCPAYQKFLKWKEERAAAAHIVRKDKRTSSAYETNVGSRTSGNSRTSRVVSVHRPSLPSTQNFHKDRPSRYTSSEIIQAERDKKTKAGQQQKPPQQQQKYKGNNARNSSANSYTNSAGSNSKPKLQNKGIVNKPGANPNMNPNPKKTWSPNSSINNSRSNSRNSRSRSVK